jgi:predicted GTPase
VKVLRRGGTLPLDERLAALARAADLAAGRLDEPAVAAAREVAARAGARAALSVDHTVAALAGATGSGKSSLFNVLSGTELAPVGVTRPTTSTPQAARWDPEGSGPLLDWLDVPRRHTVDGDGGLSRLILIDLPDHDSIEVAHRLEVDRLVGVVDLLVWVLDPQKYADAALHERYLSPLARHKDVMVVVLNQIDRLPESALARCRDDLRGLLAADGLDGVPVVAVSARTGQGVPELRGLLVDRISRRQLWAERLAADAATAADRLAEAAHLTDHAPERPAGDMAEQLTTALARAAGVPSVVAAVAKAHRHRAVAATGWPPTRWLRRLRPDPLRRLRIGAGTDRTSLPEASLVQRSELEVAVREIGTATSTGLPEPWAGTVRKAARTQNDQLADALDKAVATTSLGATHRPRWWSAAGALQWLLLTATAAGALWLTALFAVAYLRLPDVPTPDLGALPWPTVLFLGGALAGILLALLCRALAWLGGRRRARKAAKALRTAVAEVGTRLVLSPAEAERDRFTDFAAQLATARNR